MTGLTARLDYPATQPGGALLIMLPGIGITAAEFFAHGMIEAAQAADPSLAITVAEPDIGLYLEDGITRVLHEELIRPAIERGITRIWLLGISLGGMGALLYASAHPQLIEGLFLIAPFLGTKGTIAELTRAGGLPAWSPAGSNATTAECRLLLWLQAQTSAPAATPRLHLGYALQDRFAPAHKLLAACLPPARVTTTQGGHDWPSWRTLWEQMLANTPFAAPTGRCDAR